MFVEGDNLLRYNLMPLNTPEVIIFLPYFTLLKQQKLAMDTYISLSIYYKWNIIYPMNTQSFHIAHSLKWVKNAEQ